ncbi:hypothetical protein C8R45DRAFT_1087726 [Mycena sanguinolenta]|nr:hypothetical protein C8R45DRAFT_1087726 [Mycena sanguinolenta]
MHLGDSETLVAVDGVELSEFAVEYSADGKEASCWIPSECGKNFSINWEYTNASGLTVDALVWVNGTSCGRKFMSRHRTRPHNLSGCRTSVATSADTRRPLLFARQALTDYDNLLGAAISPELGSIKVEVRNVRKVPRRVKQPPPWAVHSYETPVLHEKSKKAIGHTVQFGAEFAAVNNAPKMLDLLRAQGIAPPAAGPARAPSSSSAVVLDLTMDGADDDAGEIDIKPETNKLEMRAKITELEASRSRSPLLPSPPCLRLTCHTQAQLLE